MPTYKHQLGTNKRLLHIHIPRTAGRFIQQQLWKNKFIEEQDHRSFYNEGVEVTHYHSDLYKKYLDCATIPHICVIRNPIDRFISSSIYLYHHYNQWSFKDDEHSLQKRMEGEDFFPFLENLPESEMESWFRPQLDFLTGETNIWRFEDGFGDDFGDWMADVLKIPAFPIHKVFYQPLEFIDETIKLKPTPKLIDNIREKYAEDFEILYQDQ